MKSPVSDAFDSNVNNSNAVNNLLFSRPFLSGHFRLQKYEMFLSWPKKVFRRVGEEGCVWGCQKVGWRSVRGWIWGGKEYLGMGREWKMATAIFAPLSDFLFNLCVGSARGGDEALEAISGCLHL